MLLNNKTRETLKNKVLHEMLPYHNEPCLYYIYVVALCISICIMCALCHFLYLLILRRGSQMSGANPRSYRHKAGKRPGQGVDPLHDKSHTITSHTIHTYGQFGNLFLDCEGKPVNPEEIPPWKKYSNSTTERTFKLHTHGTRAKIQTLVPEVRGNILFFLYL